MNRKELQQNTAITLIALIITIIVLLILAGVTLNMLIGENGIITKAQWAKWINEYRTVEEAEHLYELKYELNYKTQKYGSVEKKVTARGEEETKETRYPITNEKIEVESGSTLEKTIKQVNGENYVWELYKIDIEKLNLEDIKKEYVLDINSGKIYDIEGHKKGDVVYHTPDIGINTSGKDTEPPSNFTIESSYNEDEERLEIKVGEVKDNKSTTFEYEYHIKEITVDEETGETTDTETAEIVKTTTESSYYNEEIADGTYRIYVMVYDEARNSRKSDNEEIVTVKKPETVSTTDSLTITNPIVVTIDKTVTVQVIKNIGAEDEEKVSNTSFNWAVEDTNVVTVNTKGQVTGKTIGTTTLTATLKSDTSKTLTATVEVKDLITEIWTKADLEQFRDEVNNGSNYVGLEVTQMADIDLEGDNSNQWTPIGISTSKYFGGTYNGNNHKITGLYINAETSHQGLFGCANGNSIIKNVNVENGYVYTTKYCVGGVLAWGQNITIDNCIFSGSITTLGRQNTTDSRGLTGGIVGFVTYSGTNKITKCTNYGTINGKYKDTGGIVGYLQKGEIENCENNGSVTGGTCIGGIVGYLGSDSSNYAGKVINCNNKAIITSTGYDVGGIAGAMNRGSEIRNCTNYSSIIGTGKDSNSYGKVGGICGIVGKSGNNIIDKCINYGEINSTYSLCGGIAGCLQKGSITNCTNKKNANVTNVRAATGGIVGYLGGYGSNTTKGTISNCMNEADVTSTSTGASGQNTGGIAGIMNRGSTITYCGNIGNVTSYGYESSSVKSSRTGGIVGRMYSSGENIVSYCYNTGNVTGSYKYIGGISGLIATSTSKIHHCYSKGIVTGPEDIGGILGYKSSGEITDSYYLEGCTQPPLVTKTEEGEEKDEATINSYIDSIKNLI